MGLLDVFRGKRANDEGHDPAPRMRLALERASSNPSSEKAARELADAMRKATLLIAVRALPPEMSGGPRVLGQDKRVEALTTINDRGEEMLQAFTDAVELRVRNPAASWIRMSGTDVLRMALDGPFGGVVLDPAGRFLELRRDRIRQMIADHEG